MSECEHHHFFFAAALRPTFAGALRAVFFAPAIFALAFLAAALAAGFLAATLILRPGAAFTMRAEDVAIARPRLAGAFAAVDFAAGALAADFFAAFLAGVLRAGMSLSPSMSFDALHWDDEDMREALMQLIDADVLHQ